MFDSPARQEFPCHVFARLKYHTRRDRRITTKLQELIYKIDTSYVHQHINGKVTPFCVTENLMNNVQIYF